MPHIFICPDCGTELSKNYLANKKITSAMHGKPYNCKAIENKVGINAYQEPKHQQKNKNKAAGVAAAKSHKELKSVQNLNAYQTQHKNQQIQQQRENSARQIGLPGHHSQNSNSNMNSGTSSSLNKINRQ